MGTVVSNVYNPIQTLLTTIYISLVVMIAYVHIVASNEIKLFLLMIYHLADWEEHLEDLVGVAVQGPGLGRLDLTHHLSDGSGENYSHV